MPQYEALVHVLWELPFALRLPPRAFYCWEPGENTGLFDPKPEVGEVAWTRRSTILPSSELFDELGHPNNCYPLHDYVLEACLKDGRKFKTAQLKGGADGGFVEARPYTVANIFLCLQRRSDYHSQEVMDRAGAALNNIVELYRFFTMDPMARSLSVDRDCYYTLVSVGELPAELGETTPESAFEQMQQVRFGAVIGESRVHRIGLNSFEDLSAGATLPRDLLDPFAELVKSPHRLDLFHQLMLSAIRRIRRGEHALAVLDAQSALEAMVAELIVGELRRKGDSDQEIEKNMSSSGRFNTLQRRLKQIDRIAAENTPGDQEPEQFLGSEEELRWRTTLYGLRNQIVHEGLRDVAFSAAKEGLIASLHAAHRIESLSHAFSRTMRWAGSTLNLDHVRQSAGRISRLFEA